MRKVGWYCSMDAQSNGSRTADRLARRSTGFRRTPHWNGCIDRQSTFSQTIQFSKQRAMTNSPPDPDLHHAITLRPHPFHANPDRVSPSRLQMSESPKPDAKQPGQASAVETSSDDATRHRPPFQRNSSDEGDIERGSSLPDYQSLNDPYSLRIALKTDEELQTIRANVGRKRTATCGISKNPKQMWRAKKLQGFYEQQNENIERLLKPVDEHVREAKEEQGANALQYKIAVTGSFIANVLLAILQIYGAVSSGSLSLFTTMADAIFDPCSNLTLILANRAVSRVDPRKFPSGRARIETAGNIAFCFLMTSVSLILIVVSALEISRGNGGKEHEDFHLPSVIAVAIAFTTKLGLFLYCWALRNKYSQIRILWEDHRNDLFINGFGLMTSVLGSKLKWWIDPMGAIILSVLISFLWLRTSYSEFQLLIGVSADTSFLQHITYISMTHSALIKGLDTVRAWHSGPRLIVEVDVVMDEGLGLRETHDVAEELQMKLESLPDVERAYVHVDYETSHAPEHFTKKEL
ncbi:cation efflux family protein [Teratosphaeria nubilosa]|uniref:Cation efflux family protein n=1 Tax=Teratosphaeria nubilosa TaxID=161662 RepID=A0A6G1LAI0_9PEZI|nr:cation efflux family protein [Teratosphaeria nubilosa]